MDFKGLQKKVSSYWLIKRIIFLIIFIAVYIVAIVFVPKDYLLFLLVSCTVLLLLIAIYTLIFPHLQQKFYRYSIDEEKIIISCGILFRTYTIIPIIQIQDVGTSQGPLQILYKISDVTISTAGSIEVIKCLDQDIAQEIVQTLHQKLTFKLKKNEEKKNVSLQ